MNRNSKEKIFGLTASEIQAFERERRSILNFKKERRKKHILVLFEITFIILIIFSVAYIIKWTYDNIKNRQIYDNISQYISIPDNDTPSPQENEEPFLVDFDSLTSINSSCFGWLIVNGVNVSFPVVHSTNNNKYYLTHSFDKSHNPAGWIFADYKNKCDGTDRNLIIYGHNRRDGSMFSSLKNILNEDWYTNKNNLIIKLYTKNGLDEYQVFSLYEIKAESYYITTDFNSNSSYLSFITKLKNRSIFNFNIDLSAEDKILTLSTCSNNNANRIVLHAKKIQALD